MKKSKIDKSSLYYMSLNQNSNKSDKQGNPLFADDIGNTTDFTMEDMIKNSRIFMPIPICSFGNTTADILTIGFLATQIGKPDDWAKIFQGYGFRYFVNPEKIYGYSIILTDTSHPSVLIKIKRSDGKTSVIPIYNVIDRPDWLPDSEPYQTVTVLKKFLDVLPRYGKKDMASMIRLEYIANGFGDPGKDEDDGKEKDNDLPF